MNHYPDHYPEGRIMKLETMMGELVKLNSDHEKRLRALERVIGYGTASMSTILFLLKMLKVI